MVCFCRWDVQEHFRWAIELAGYRMRSQIVWDKGVHGMGDTRSQFAPRHEIAWFAVKGKYRFPGKRPVSVQAVRKVMGGQRHPNQKPEALMLDLVEVLTEPGALVLDPFFGSGPVVRACRQAGRHVIGVELESRYYDGVVEDLEQQAA